MNWYKQSKLIDLKHHTDPKDINAKCMYCNRWATHPNNQKAGREGAIWKTEEELNPEEHQEVNKTKNNINYVSHGVCEYCRNVLEEIKNRGEEPFDFNPQYIKELSLGLTNYA